MIDKADQIAGATLAVAIFQRYCGISNSPSAPWPVLVHGPGVLSQRRGPFATYAAVDAVMGSACAFLVRPLRMRA
jgi:hypothetical protein